MKATFGNIEKEVLLVQPGSTFFEGVQRSTLEIHFPVTENSLDELHQLMLEKANTQTITISNKVNHQDQSTAMQVFDNFCILADFALREVVPVTPNSPELPEKEQHIVVVLARYTEMELQVEKLQQLMLNAGLL